MINSFKIEISTSVRYDSLQFDAQSCYKSYEWLKPLFMIEYVVKKKSFIIEWMKLNRCKRHLADAPGDKRQWMRKDRSREE